MLKDENDCQCHDDSDGSAKFSHIESDFFSVSFSLCAFPLMIERQSGGMQSNLLFKKEKVPQ